jgi:hypothetical protein
MARSTAASRENPTSFCRNTGLRFDITNEKNEGTQSLSFQSISKFVQDGSIRADLHLDNILFNRDRILEIAFSIEKLLKPGHHVICNLKLSLQLRAEDTNTAASVDDFIR